MSRLRWPDLMLPPINLWVLPREDKKMLKQNTHWNLNTIPVEIGKVYKTREGRDVEAIHVAAVGGAFNILCRDCKSNRTFSVNEDGYYFCEGKPDGRDLMLDTPKSA